MTYQAPTTSLRPPSRPTSVSSSARPTSRPSQKSSTPADNSSFGSFVAPTNTGSGGLASPTKPKKQEEKLSMVDRFWSLFDSTGGTVSEDDTTSSSERALSFYDTVDMTLPEVPQVSPPSEIAPTELDPYVGAVGTGNRDVAPNTMDSYLKGDAGIEAIMPPAAGLMTRPAQGGVSEIDTDTGAPVVDTGDDTEETNTSSRLDSKGLTPITLTDKAQEKLFDLGFVEVGTADGVAGANTRSAARRYQGASDLTVNGRLDGDTLGSLTSATADLDTIMQRQIAFHEGQKNYPYKDSLGLWTIGIGHLIGSGSDEDLENSGYSQYSRANPMPDSDVTELFQEDLTDHKAIAEGYDFYDDMNEKGKRAIIDLTFNMGDFLNKRNKNGTYMWGNLRRQLANSDWDAAADNLASATYGRQVGQRAITVTDMLRQAGD